MFLFLFTFGFIGWWLLKLLSFDVSYFALGYLKASYNLFLNRSSTYRRYCNNVFFSLPLILNSDPLAQFFLETFNFTNLNYLIFELSLVKFIFFLYSPVIVCFFLLFVLQNLFAFSSFVYLVPTVTFINLNFILNITRSIMRENLSVFATRYTIVLDFIFYTILFFNMLGLVPYSFTITSQLSFTLFMSTSFFVAINLIGIRVKGIKVFSLFLPSGVPLLISPFLILIEIVSYFARLFSLGIRLFANMMAGHALTIILSGYSWVFLFNQIPVGIISLIIIYCVISLEFMVAFLQAYVFTMLVGIYINDVLSGH